jgi:hypothetical protein
LFRLPLQIKGEYDFEPSDFMNMERIDDDIQLHCEAPCRIAQQPALSARSVAPHVVCACEQTDGLPPSMRGFATSAEKVPMYPVIMF